MFHYDMDNSHWVENALQTITGSNQDENGKLSDQIMLSKNCIKHFAL